MQSLTKTEENLLLDGVKQAVDLVDSGGISPNEALEKVAKELNYSPGFLKAACNAFNTGRQTAQWEANDSILDKLASFPLADYSAIHAAIWNGEEEKRAAVSAKYLNPPIKWDSYEAQEKEALLRLDLNQAGWSKSASAEEPSQFVQDYEGEIRVKLAYNKVNWEGREVEESRNGRGNNGAIHWALCGHRAQAEYRSVQRCARHGRHWLFKNTARFFVHKHCGCFCLW